MPVYYETSIPTYRIVSEAKVALMTQVSNSFICGFPPSNPDHNLDNAVNTQTGVNGGWEWWTLLTLEGGMVALRSIHGTYLTVCEVGEGARVYLSSYLDWCQTFTKQEAGNGTFRFKTSALTYIKARPEFPAPYGKVDASVEPDQYTRFWIVML